MFTLPQRQDWVASLVVFIVALPLSLGIAIASGCSPAAGLITAVIGGVVAGALAGAPLAVTGPAAGLTALVFQIVQTHGIRGLAIITVLCGLIQFAMGVIRAGKVFTLIPKPVLEGVLTAIGLIIVLGQLHVLVGAGIPKSALQSVLQMPQSLGGAVGGGYSLGLAPVLLCGLLAIGIQILWSRLFRKAAWVPAALPAVVLVTLLSGFWEMPRVELSPLLPVAQEATAHFLELRWLGDLTFYLVPAIGLAVVASAESLLTARAVDVLVSQRGPQPPANLNRELMAQGAANAISGIAGGLPVTGVMVRSAANFTAGGKTRWSTILHGAWIAIFVGMLPFVLKQIPLTALAAVLILTGVKLINLPHLVHTVRTQRLEGMMWVFTALAICATDLLKGLLISLATYGVVHHKVILIKMQSVLSTARNKANGYSSV